MRTLLLVARWFPPAGGISAVRWAKLLKYLRPLGWRSVVLTASLDETAVTDRPDGSLANDELSAERVSAPHPRLERILGGGRLARFLQSKGPVAGSGPASENRSLAAAMRSWMFPDSDVTWIPGGVVSGRALLRRIEPDVICSTSPPVTAHVIARSLVSMSHLPWVAELRDPWSDGASIPSSLHRWGHRRLEADVLRHATRIVCVADPHRARLSRHPGVAHRLEMLSNGFDPDDFDRAVQPDGQCFLVRHVGSLYGDRDPMPFLRGVHIAVLRHPQLRKDLRIELIGSAGLRLRASMQTFIATHGLGDLVTVETFVTHHAATRAMQTAELLLLLVGETFAFQVPGKLFEYLGARRRILVDSVRGPACEIVQRLGVGTCVPRQPEELAAALLAEYERWRAVEAPVIAEVDAFSHPVLAGKLAAILERARQRAGAGR